MQWGLRILEFLKLHVLSTNILSLKYNATCVVAVSYRLQESTMADGNTHVSYSYWRLSPRRNATTGTFVEWLIQSDILSIESTLKFALLLRNLIKIKWKLQRAVSWQTLNALDRNEEPFSGPEYPWISRKTCLADKLACPESPQINRTIFWLLWNASLSLERTNSFMLELDVWYALL